MQPVQQVAEERERRAAEEFGRAQKLVEEHERQLRELKSYRKEYLESYQVKGATGMRMSALRDWQQFLAKLDQAIEQQQRSLQAANRQCEEKRAAWHQARGKQKAIGKVVDRFKAEESRERDRREQKEIDEIAGRRSRESKS